MAGDPVSLEFLGEQLKRVQADIRDLKARILLVESDQADLRRDMERQLVALTQLETKIDVLSERLDDRFDKQDDRFLEMFKLLAGLKHDIDGLKER